MTSSRPLLLALALAGSALSGAAAAAPPVVAGAGAMMATPHAAGPVTAAQLNGRTIPVKTVSIPCKLDEEKTMPNHYTITFTPVGPPGELKPRDTCEATVTTVGYGG